MEVTVDDEFKQWLYMMTKKDRFRHLREEPVVADGREVHRRVPLHVRSRIDVG